MKGIYICLPKFAITMLLLSLLNNTIIITKIFLLYVSQCICLILKNFEKTTINFDMYFFKKSNIFSPGPGTKYKLQMYVE